MMKCLVLFALGLPLVFGFSFTPNSRPRNLIHRRSSPSECPDDGLPHVVVVGGGWGGWGATKALLESGCRVTLIDAQPDPAAQVTAKNQNGKPVDVGQRGFWKDYPNIEALVSSLGLKEEDVFTPFTNSSFFSPDGLEAVAPVFSSSEFPQLPSPLGQVFATFPLFKRLPLEDRASMAGLLLATLDCLAFDEGGPGPDPEVLAAYDRMSAHELFLRFGLSKRLVEDFVKPTLLVGLFKPPEELSALVVMELLYYYALAHQDSFDVRWIRRGTVASSLIAPLAAKLQRDFPLTVLGGTFVTEIADGGRSSVLPAADGQPSPPSTPSGNTNGEDDKTKKTKQAGAGLRFAGGDSATVVRFKQGSKDAPVFGSLEGVSGVVLALGAKGMQSVVGSSPLLSQHAPFAKAGSLKGIDVVSCRLWLDKVVPTDTPANVLSRFEKLRGAGGTFFMLDQLQVKSAQDEAYLWGEEEEGAVDDQEGAEVVVGQETAAALSPASQWSGPRGSVVACDFYNAGALLGLDDASLVDLLVGELLPKAVPAFQGVKVVDSWVGKYPGAVSWFSPGSFESRPRLHGAGKSVLRNVKCAGDWVRLGEREHGAKGLCQERAFVSGLEAANALLGDLRVAGEGSPTSSPLRVKKHVVIPVREDEPQVKAGMAAARKLPKFLRTWVR